MNKQKKLLERIKESKQRITALALSLTIGLTSLVGCNLHKDNNSNNTHNEGNDSSISDSYVDDTTINNGNQEDIIPIEPSIGDDDEENISNEQNDSEKDEEKIDNENNEEKDQEEVSNPNHEEDEENVKHTHDFGDFKVLNAKYHERVCACGKVETLEH